MNNFEKTYSKWLNVNAQLHNECMEYIKKALTTTNEEIYFDEDLKVSVTYDGGNHPEYYANPYSRTNSIFLKNGEPYLEIEDCSEYLLSNITTNELADVTLALKEQIERDYDTDGVDE